MRFFAGSIIGSISCCQGKGTGTYTVGDKQKTVSINNEYHWDRMDDKYDSKSTTLNKIAVQYLMADAGAAASMTYEMKGSSAYVIDAATAIADNFQYDSLSLHYLNRMYYSDSEWMEIVYRELSQSHPILYGGSDESYGGHAFVFSGVDADGKVYVNWGWDGTGNGYYDFTDLTPVDGLKKMGYTFGSHQEMIVGHRTPSSESPYGFTSQWVCDEPYSLRTKDINQVELGLLSLWNLHILSFDGVIELFFENQSGGSDDFLIFYDSADSGIVLPQYGFSSSDEESIKIPINLEDLAAGNYKVYFRTKDKRDSDYQKVHCIGGDFFVELTKNNDGTIATSSDAIPEPSPVEIVHKESISNTDRYFDLQGRELNGSTKGLLIRRQGDEVKKVMNR
ncbi:MAG: C10 family peptidase [Prevotella sp.]|nr:C10 family peptidase [Prevotella sp.]